jgi:hypothetical protein
MYRGQSGMLVGSWGFAMGLSVVLVLSVAMAGSLGDHHVRA